jgi:SAM-dependent methyltransferase
MIALGYRVMYLLGFTPWERTPIPERLVELIEGPAALPAGRALDLGCGSGRLAVYLGQRGWQVTAVDLVPRALGRARARVARAGLGARVRIVGGDVTRLDRAGVGDGYDLLLDSGCFHGLPPEARGAYAAGVTRAARAGAVLLMLGFLPGRRGPLPSGTSPAELDARFPGWRRELSVPATTARVPAFVARARPHWHLLRRARRDA